MLALTPPPPQPHKPARSLPALTQEYVWINIYNSKIRGRLFSAKLFIYAIEYVIRITRRSERVLSLN